MRVLVVCRANVCRSRLAAGLLAAPLAELGAEVVSGGVQPAAPGVVCLDVTAALEAAGAADGGPEPRGVTRDVLDGADLVLASSRDVASALAVLDLAARPRIFTLRRAAATAAWVAAALPGVPEGAPALPPPDAREARWQWFVAELDAGRGYAAAVESAPDPENPDDIPDPHLAEIDHDAAVAAVAQACAMLIDAATAIIDAQGQPEAIDAEGQRGPDVAEDQLNAADAP